METPIFQEINGEGFIKIKVREETEESLRNKIEMLYDKYFLEGMTYINEHEEKCMYREMNES
ncbi:hypothetical protein C1646_759625 [Rhizophagus diaphanus]|nr:hypothetical protein C1646_759625 [Rhizophagus diaphanus] [Rhizophagus sp. MUCL 43196]